MTQEQHPITPPLELVEQWDKEGTGLFPPAYQMHIATQAARWGADQELEACCALMDDWGLDEADLRAARRPKPPSLKEEALEMLTDIERLTDADFYTIRRALEALP